jgi:flagellar basal body-associated protein FliL
MNTKQKVSLSLVVIILSMAILVLIHWQTTTEFAKMTPRQQEQTVMAIYEASFNAAQTNWTMTIVPRTNK